MRILLVSHGYPPDSVGGVEQHVAGLAHALVRSGHDVHVYAKLGAAHGAQGDAIGPTGERPRITRVVYRYEGLTNLQSLYAVPVLDAAFDRFLAQAGPFDVAHVHHLTGMSTGLLAVLAARGIPSVMTLHDYWLQCPRGQMWRDDGSVCERVEPTRCADCLRPAFGGFVPGGDAGDRTLAELHELARTTLRTATRLLVPSARAIPPFAALGIPADSIAVVENGVDVTALSAVPALALDPSRPLRFGFLGTIIPSKGLDVLVEAFLSLPPGSAELHVHGNLVPYHGDHGYGTRVFARLDPTRPRLTYHGPYQTTELPAILGSIDVLVAPARWAEAFGLTVREALAAGRPVVASRIGGLIDAFEHGRGGLFVEPGSVDGLRRTLRELVDDRQSVQRLADASRTASPPRGFDAMAADLEAIYQGMA